VSKQFQRLDPVCFSIGCSLVYYSQRQKIPVLIAVVKNITIRDSCPKSGQIRSKFWPEPDLAGFPKKGGFAGAGVEIRYIPTPE